MKALISPLDDNRICQIEAVEFPIAEPFHWVECGDNVTTEWTYENGVFKEPVETPEQRTLRLERALDAYIDEQAQSYRYESIRTMVTYAGDPNTQFNVEGTAALAFRSRCYTLALMIISEVSQGRPVPTEAELIAEMPTLASFIN